MNAVAYETDFHSWALQQAEILQAKTFDKLDVSHLIEELQAMSARERWELISRLRVLLMHLLKWQYQPNYRGKLSWERTINALRDDIAILLETAQAYCRKP